MRERGGVGVLWVVKSLGKEKKSLRLLWFQSWSLRCMTGSF